MNTASIYSTCFIQSIFRVIISRLVSLNNFLYIPNDVDEYSH